MVRLLFDGPTPSEAATATAELPRLTGTPDVVIDDDGTFSVQLPENVPPLSHLAMLQLACTMAHVAWPLTALPADASWKADSTVPTGTAQRAPAHTLVHVRGNGWTMTQSAASYPGPAPFPP
ncbi:hypothetical protein ABT314_22290 [Streptomyces spiralis]|nr:hypothetical protein [Streptomyces spiralis]